jgi:hypothetical protein
MGRINLRDANEFDPYGVEGTGGLLGMLQAMIRQGQVEPRADLNPRNPGYETPTVPQMSDFGQTPPTRITVRPFDAYSPSDSEASGGEGGRLGRWLALQAEQSRDQSTPLESGQPQSAPYDPNFRQLSRAPIAVRSQGAIGPFNPPDDQSSPTYSPFGGSTALDPLRTSRQGDKAAQPDRWFSDRIQASWDHPHPYGLVAKLKEALNGIEQAVQGSIDATSVPSTEEEAFRQNQGRELGPIGAWKAASLLAPLTSGGVGRMLVRPLGNGLRNGLPGPTSARITGQGIERPIANTTASPLRFVSGNRNLFSEFQSPAAIAKAIAELAGFNPQNPALLPPIPKPAFPDWNEPLKMASRKGGGQGRDDGEDDPDPDVWLERMRKKWAADARARDQAGRKATAGRGYDPGDYCSNRYLDEEKNCYARSHEYADPDFLEACRDHARERRRKCVQNGGRPHPDEKKEWGLDEEEVFRNLHR